MVCQKATSDIDCKLISDKSSKSARWVESSKLSGVGLILAN